MIIGGKAYEIKRERTATDMHLWVGSVRYSVQLRDPRSLRSRASADDGKGPRKLLAPMPGKILKLLVAEGDSVEHGQALAVLEAMKMETTLYAESAAIVKKIRAAAGDMVDHGAVIIEFSPFPADPSKSESTAQDA